MRPNCRLGISSLGLRMLACGCIVGGKRKEWVGWIRMAREFRASLPVICVFYFINHVVNNTPPKAMVIYMRAFHS